MALLNREQAAERLGISISTLDSERYRGNLAYIQRKRNGKVWIPETAIEEYLNRGLHEVKPMRTVGQTYRKRRKIG